MLREVTSVEKISLRPHYDTAFFRNIAIPTDSVVYVVKHGKVVEGYVQPGPDIHEGGRTALVLRAGLWTAAAVCLILGSWAAYRRLYVFRTPARFGKRA